MDIIVVYKRDRIHKNLYNLLEIIYEIQENKETLV